MDLVNLMITAKPEVRNLSWGRLWQSRFNYQVSSSYKVVYASSLWDFRGMVMMIFHLMQLPKMGWVHIAPEGTCETKTGQMR